MASRGRGEQGRRLSPWDSEELERRIAAGETQEEVAGAIGGDVATVIRWIMHNGGLRPDGRKRSPRNLSVAEREEIAVGIARGESGAVIGRRLGRACSTVTREIARSGGRQRYRASAADRRALDEARRPKQPKLARNARLRREVEARLQKRWSPEQISARLALDFPDDAAMRISHEAIYQSLFVQSRRALRRDLSKCLRTRRVHRRPSGRRHTGPLKDMAPIAQRPAEADDRKTPGHWQGDLIIVKGGRSAIATLVERTTRLTVLVHLPAGRTAGSLHAALATTLPKLPAGWAPSLTWDQGTEMADHARITADTGVPIYFCRPSCPWQRGTNENTNGLLRQYLPNGTDLSTISQHKLNRIAAELNGRPRRVLQWMTPTEAFNQTSAMTT